MDMKGILAGLAAAFAAAGLAQAQVDKAPADEHAGHTHGAAPMPTPAQPQHAHGAPAPAQPQHAHTVEKTQHHGMDMRGMYGPYPMAREASGTAWQPDSSPHGAIMAMAGEWHTMVHGY